MREGQVQGGGRRIGAPGEGAKSAGVDPRAPSAFVSEAEIAHYRRDGILRIDARAIVGTGSFERMRAALLRIEAEGYPDHPATDVYPTLVYRRPLHKHYPEVAAVARSPALGEIAARLAGVDHVRLYEDEIFTKLPGMGFTPWHQDSERGMVDFNYMSIWIALDDIDLDMGALRYMPGSHLLGMLESAYPPGTETGARGESEAVDAMLDAAVLARCGTMVEAPLRAGEAMIHSGLTLHGARANTTDRPRRGYSVVLMPADTRYGGLTERALHIGQSHVARETGLIPGGLFDHPDFPITY